MKKTKINFEYAKYSQIFQELHGKYCINIIFSSYFQLFSLIIYFKKL
jgi:hypothetical protein